VAITSIATKLGMTPETLRKWVRWAEADEGLRPGLTTSKRERMTELERENRELRRANEILKTTAFFGAELDRHGKMFTYQPGLPAPPAHCRVVRVPLHRDMPKSPWP
jgi:transposase-like protein